MNEAAHTETGEHPCGDYPAPCNCDDPVTHDGHGDQAAHTEAERVKTAQRRLQREYREHLEAEVARLSARPADEDGLRALLATWDRKAVEYGSGFGIGHVFLLCARDLRAVLAARTEADEACGDCGHTHTPNGCAGPATASDRWAGVTPAACDCAPSTPEPQAASWCCPACRAEGWMCPALCQRPCCAEHALAAERVLCACGHAKFMHGDTAGDSGCRSCKCWSWRPATANPLDDLCCDGEGCPRCDPEPQPDVVCEPEAAHTEAERLAEAIIDGDWADWGQLRDLTERLRDRARPADEAAHTEAGCDNYLPPLTCLTAPSSETGRCDKCKAAARPADEADGRLGEIQARLLASDVAHRSCDPELTGYPFSTYTPIFIENAFAKHAPGDENDPELRAVWEADAEVLGHAQDDLRYLLAALRDRVIAAYHRGLGAGLAARPLAARPAHPEPTTTEAER